MTRTLKGGELIRLADCFGIRAAAITGLAVVRERASVAARAKGDASMATVRERLYAYLELDSYLTGQGIPGEPRGNGKRALRPADQIRAERGLGDSPVKDMYEFVHVTEGIDVISMQAPDAGHGISMCDPVTGRVVIAVVTTSHVICSSR
ncbi:hypothetical protein GCM10010435_03320 [Winogradskya consettensis]|uniref:Uncharacterized protein n=1 Tax=Winogradskya consettensis TaxID=113560 RepID=A0A919VW83_9ACTN|nr:hypothetical protein [Actinoplanes consettensis]GIM81898.1 hypothetical protein Aco04nite_78950 [Actinoplanes consettensis]